MMSFPVYFHFGPFSIHAHLLFETLAYAVGFRVYLELRRRGDAVDDFNRWWVIAAAALGAVVGSKLLFLFEDPALTWRHMGEPGLFLSGKTIVGALIGGLFTVEFAKRRLGVTRRTGDLFALPLCVGIAIGRIGCFLTGTEDHTAGIATTLPWGINFGDGIPRHPTQLYEIIFAIVLGFAIFRMSRRPHLEGDLFKVFMVSYFSFRLAVDFLKPDVRVFAGLSSIQIACVAMLCYYGRDILRWAKRDRGSDNMATTNAVDAVSSGELSLATGDRND